jgi:hypothetical protein
MGVRRKEYGERLEKNIRKGQTLAEAHKGAAKASEAKPETKPKGITKLAWWKRKAKEAAGGEKTYISKKRYEEMQAARRAKKFTTTRTKGVSSGLKAGGLSDAEIRGLRGK